ESFDEHHYLLLLLYPSFAFFFTSLRLRQCRKVFNTGDSRTAKDSLQFLVQWLHRFPKYNRREIYITGESYAGHYVPQLAREIMHYNKRSKNPINLKGIMVGNAVTDNHYDNLGTVPYWWSHAMISDRTYHQLVNTCEFSRQEESDECETVYSYAMEKEFSSIDQYNIYAPPCNKSSDGCVSLIFPTPY
ncbi:BnaAnng31760D, partial [Brassica napus]